MLMERSIDQAERQGERMKTLRANHANQGKLNVHLTELLKAEKEKVHLLEEASKGLIKLKDATEE